METVILSKVAEAVKPLRDQAIATAKERAESYVASGIKKLEEGNWDREIVAPYPDRCGSRNEYHTKRANYEFIRCISKPVSTFSHRPNTPDPGVLNEEGCQNFINRCMRDAAASYDAYVAKLDSKIGETVTAQLIGDHLWSHSIIEVSKADGSVQRWKTQMIINISSLGKLFNQWPTRLMK